MMFELKFTRKKSYQKIGGDTLFHQDEKKEKLIGYFSGGLLC